MSLLAKFLLEFNKYFYTFVFNFSILFLLSIICIMVYLYDFNLFIFCLEQSFFILLFFLLTIFYLDSFKLSHNKWIKYFQVIIFILFIIYIIYYGVLYLWNYNLLYDVKINLDDIKDVVKDKDITIKGKVVLDK
jgi:hypothetical protein